MKLIHIGTAALLMLTPALYAQATSSSPAPDKYAWLEDVSGERSMSWVNAPLTPPTPS